MSADESADPAEPLTGSGRGRRRESSRHRVNRLAGLPPWLAWLFRRGVPLISLLPALVAVALVQTTSPQAQQLPEGDARFAFAGAFAVTQPGALGGPPLPGVPVVGWFELGVLLRVLGGGVAPLVASRLALLLLTLATIGLTWWCARRAGASGLAAGAAAAVAGVAPIAVATHTAASVAAVAVPELLLALALATRRAEPAVIAAGALGALALLTAPPAAVALPGLAWAALAQRPSRARLRLVVDIPEPPPLKRRAVLLGAGFGGVLVVAAVVALVLLALPRTPAGAVLAGIAGAAAAQAPFPAVGGAAVAAWLRTDPLSLLVALVALGLAVRSTRLLPASATALLVLLGSLWPDGGDAVGPVALLLPLAALAVARAVDEAVVLLGDPRFARSVVGSGWLMGVAAVLVVAAVVWGVGLTRLRPAPYGSLTQASGWLRTSVPAGQVVLADLAAWPTLQASSARPVGWYAAPDGGGPAPSSTAWSRADYVVAVGSVPHPSGSAGVVLRRARTVTAFRSGAAPVRVLAVPAGAVGSTPAPVPSPGSTGSPGSSATSTATPWPGSAPSTPPPSANAAALRAAATARRGSGAELAQNPRITLSGADRAALQAGEVDTRVAIVLAQLAAVHPITVAGFPRVSGNGSEVRRQVLISTVDGKRVPGDPRSTDVLLQYLSRLRGTYATSSLGATGSGVLATFPPDPTFVPPS